MNSLRGALFAAMLCASTTFAGQITFLTNLTGPSESPANASPGTGSGTVVFDTAAHTLTLDLTFSGLLSTTTASHLHCCTALPDTGTAGVATMTPTFSGFPLGVTSGTFHQVLDLTLATSYNSSFITNNGGAVSAAETALLNGAVAGSVYWNVHTNQFPGGEIRGFLVQTPEPATFALAGASLLALIAARRRRQ